MVSGLTVAVPKLGSLMGPGTAALGPKVEIEVLVGAAEQGAQGTDEERELPTDVVVDLGLLEVSGPASGRVDLGGELSAEGYELSGAIEAVDAEVGIIRWKPLGLPPLDQACLGAEMGCQGHLVGPAEEKGFAEPLPGIHPRPCPVSTN